MSNIATCIRCNHRQRVARGSCLCLGDNQKHDIIDKANSNACPRYFFGGPENPVVLRVTLKYRMRPPEQITEGVAEVRRGLRMGGCCDPPTQPR